MLHQPSAAAFESDGGRGLVVFLPGTWMSPESLSLWRDLFDLNGYDSAVDAGSPDGRPGRRGPRLFDQVRGVSGAGQRLPIVIGLGMGAVTAQVVVARPGSAAAAIAIAPAAAGWVTRTAAIRLARSRAALGARPRAGTGLLTSAAFARGYASSVGGSEAEALHRRFTVADSARPLLRTSLTWRDPARTDRVASRPPLLILSGGRDRLCSEQTASTWTRFGRRQFPEDVTDHHVFPDRGHSLTIDSGWRDVAYFCLDWLTAQNL